jgi:hypothetical protein
MGEWELVERDELLANPNSSILKFKVGNGSRIFMWLDVWHPDGCLLDKYGPRTVYEVGNSLDAKLSTIICNGEWYWPHARSDRIVDLQSKLRRWRLVLKISQFGIVKKGSMYAQKLGKPFGWKGFQWSCGNWFGIQGLYLVTPSFCGWFLGMQWLLRKGCVDGVFKGIVYVYFAEEVWRIENIYSFYVASANEYGRKWWLFVW